MIPNDKGLTSPLFMFQCDIIGKGLTFTPFNCFYFIEENNNFFFFSLSNAYLNFHFLVLHYDYVNSLFKFKVNDDETI